VSTLGGRRVVVVGASAGIGRSFGVQAVQAGAGVVLVARRAEALQRAVAEAGGGHAVAADVCDAAGIEALVGAAVERFTSDGSDGSDGSGRDGGAVPAGPIDLVVHCAGATPLRLLRDSDGDDWRRTFEVNVVAVNQLIRAVLPHMAPGGIVAVLSSEAATRPWTGLVAYAASKAALDTSLHGWRLEHPEVRFAGLTVGATQPTEFGDGFDVDLLGTAYADWARHGMLQEAFMDTDELAGFLAGTLATALAHPGVGIEHMVLRSPSPVLGRKDIHGASAMATNVSAHHAGQGRRSRRPPP
jgi:NAD(P)-dependent dehydrogenase (short-subunit alcohol dehydrogenase family)